MAENEAKRQATKEKLQDALVRLCEVGDYRSVSVRQICDEAGMNHSTFYRYYPSKEELLADIENSYIDDTRNITRNISNFKLLDSPEDYERYRDVLTEDLGYHRAHRDRSRFLLSSMGDLRFSRKMEDSVAESYRSSLEASGRLVGNDDGDEEYLVRFFSTGFVATISRWLRDDDMAPEQMADFLVFMIGVFSGGAGDTPGNDGDAPETDETSPENEEVGTS